MNRPSSLRQINYSHALLIFGMVLSLLVVMFRPAGAIADLPATVGVYKTSEGTGSLFNVKVRDGDLTPITDVDYSVILTGKKKPSTVKLSGVPLVEVLKKGGVDTENVKFVKVRFGDSDDAGISLIPLNQSDTARPPIILSSGDRPKLGPFPTPAIVPGQLDLNNPLSQESFINFKAGSKIAPIKLVPGKAGANLMKVKVERGDRRKNGEYPLTAKIVSGSSSSESKSYEWYGYNDKGDLVKIPGSGRTIVTTDGTDGNARRTITVIVKEPNSGSTGVGSGNYVSTKKQKGNTKNPYPEPTPATGTGDGTGAGNGAGINGGSLNGGSSSALPGAAPQPTTPLPSQPVPTTPTPTEQTTAPTEATTSSAVDSTAITNAAQNVSGTGGLTTVSGVLLSAPSAAPAAAAGGGSPISALPAPVADQLNSIFQPVNDVDDAWAYLLALLFAFTFSGAVREWVKP